MLEQMFILCISGFMLGKQAKLFCFPMYLVYSIICVVVGHVRLKYWVHVATTHTHLLLST